MIISWNKATGYLGLFLMLLVVSVLIVASLKISPILLMDDLNTEIDTDKSMGTSTTTNSEAREVVLSYVAPKDQQAYIEKVFEPREAGAMVYTDADFVIRSVTKTLLPASTTRTELIRASAELAANQISTQIPPGYMTIVEFKIDNGVVQYLLNAEELGSAYAGISIALTQVKPLVERTVKFFPEVKEVHGAGI